MSMSMSMSIVAGTARPWIRAAIPPMIT